MGAGVQRADKSSEPLISWWMAVDRGSSLELCFSSLCLLTSSARCGAWPKPMPRKHGANLSRPSTSLSRHAITLKNLRPQPRPQSPPLPPQAPFGRALNRPYMAVTAAADGGITTASFAAGPRTSSSPLWRVPLPPTGQSPPFLGKWWSQLGSIVKLWRS